MWNDGPPANTVIAVNAAVQAIDVNDISDKNQILQFSTANAISDD